MKKLVTAIKNKKTLNRIKIISFIFVFLFTSVFLINSIFNVNVVNILTTKILNSLGVYTEEIKSVGIESNDYGSKTGGSWHIDKSAIWTSRTEAKITFDVDTIRKARGEHKDVVLVLDVSGSMHGEKMERVKGDAIELVNYLLEDINNRVAIISFSDKSNILSNFSNNREELITKIETITDGGETNYNAALKNVDLVMEGYTKQSNKDVVTLFLTDGYPNIDTPNQISTYKVLKDKYPYMSINGIQYEMGTNILNEIKEISDYHYIANVNTLKDVLFEISVSPEVYEYFEIVDYINDDYFYVNNVSDIEVSLGEVKLEEGNGLQKITWNLGNYTYHTGKKATMNINISLKDEYKDGRGLYPTNSKEIIKIKLPDLNEEKIESTDTPVLKSYYNVIYDTNPPAGCDIKEVTEEEHFIYENIPKKNDELTCDGYLFKGWEVVENVTKVNDEIFVMPDYDVNIRGIWTKQSISKSMNGTIHEKVTLYKEVKRAAEENKGAELYTGEGSDTFKNNVYYYNGDSASTKNNVIFGGFCWKIVRTTDTGGVKIIYNGIPSKEGTCNNTGKASQIETNSAFNDAYPISPGYEGYMYNKIIATTYGYTRFRNRYKIFSLDEKSSSNYYYGEQISYDKTTQKYTLGNNVEKKIWSDNFENLLGYYTCRSETSTSCSEVFYVANGTSSTQYGISLTKGKMLKDINKTMTFGTSIIENDNRTFTLENPITTTIDNWYNDYSNFENYYICSDQVSTTCENVYSVTNVLSDMYYYWSSKDNFLYGNSFTYDTNTKKYKLVDTKQFWDFKVDYTELNNRHYTCLNKTGECTTLSYFYFSKIYQNYYISLTDGKSVEDALYEMLWKDDVNVDDSNVKEVVDTWYENNMIEYTDKLEDTIFCNDRSISILGGWNPNGGDVTTYLDFSPKERSQKKEFNLNCSNKVDSFTTSVDNGNGKLKYPVGLLTMDEARLVDYKQMRTGGQYWLMSPFFVGDNYIIGFGVQESGHMYGNDMTREYGVRPSVSLKPGTLYSSGDGSATDPYIVAD